ncbi:30S ribosomal protein S10 [Mycoplasmopsis gallinacea]|uniref:Small ribosomal subunit protein uS10 n=1 Tax=Mycoplasmopsis gallinacea TaxID=29556 RepID=A0A0D5ZJM1_9BACT|nr:30S ribosomal protein S10 [Mycoplasmopsis gallinacea]AKA50088.1 30S ribosomal protein S10 [Mycoplasmopsis gallinacea]QIW62143.1 30S ribosomal protein S10 [Mycoplasmopsis gallinacea]VEU58788.1 30S ribosomal protein S10 [Mycoplasmopsis gallinacea]
MNKLNVKVQGFDHALVDAAAKKIVLLAEETKAKVSGPVPLPTKREEITILRSVHINKPSREQFESRTHQRLIVISEFANEKETLAKLKRIELPAGVQIQVKVK